MLTADRQHFIPTSVGALMDPEYLRQALRDAAGSGTLGSAAHVVAPARWRAGIRRLVTAFVPMGPRP
jgi:hypothetical protein